jgi:LacI family transcriptional regulator
MESKRPTTLKSVSFFGENVKQMTNKRQRITLDDVAREAGVSAMTVSRVINNTGRISSETREHVSDVIARLGYRPSRTARALVTNRTYMIGVVIPDITNPYFSEITQGVEETVREDDYSVILANTNESASREEVVLNHIDASMVDGLIVCSSRLPDEILLPQLERHQAVVVVNRKVPEELASSVRTSYGLGFRAIQSARYLAKAGHERIGYVYLGRSAAMTMDIDQIIEQLAAEGIFLKREWCVSSRPTWQHGYDTGKAFLEKFPELTAVIGGNDLIALGILRAARDLGRKVPEDLAIIGGDDILMASQVTPPLTTFRMPKHEIGVVAAQLLLKRIAGDMTYREHLYDEILIERGTAP